MSTGSEVVHKPKINTKSGLLVGFELIIENETADAYFAFWLWEQINKKNLKIHSDVEKIRRVLRGKASHDGFGDNRRQLRLFTGFNFKEGDDQFQARLSEILDEFSQIQLISIANLLHFNIQGVEADISKYTLQALIDLRAFQISIAPHTDSETETENVIRLDVCTGQCFDPRAGRQN